VITVAVANISWQGHLGGFIGGVLLGGAIVYAPRKRRTTWQLAGIGGIAVIIAVAILARIAVLA
jgi:membrane associated rhomboid family serine protease